MIPGRLDLPRAAEEARAAIILVGPLGAGEHAAGGSRNAQITAAVCTKEKREWKKKGKDLHPIERRNWWTRRKEGRKEARGCTRGEFVSPPGKLSSLSLTSIDRDVLVEHVPGLEAVKDAFFVRVQDNLRKSRDSVAALAPIAGQAKKQNKRKKKWSKTFKPIVPGSDSTGPGNASPQ